MYIYRERWMQEEINERERRMQHKLVRIKQGERERVKKGCKRREIDRERKVYKRKEEREIEID